MAGKRVTLEISYIAGSGNVCHKTFRKCQCQSLSGQGSAKHTTKLEA